MTDISRFTHIHFIGINGIGMSGLARLLLAQNRFHVTGSDKKLDSMADTLRSLGAVLFEGHHPSNLPKVDPVAVVVSSGIPSDNVEVCYARQQGIPIMHRSDLLHLLMRPYKPLLVTGTHGKTTTSSLVAHTLFSSGKDPAFAVGGILQNYATNAHFGRGDYFVAEADESDGTFLRYEYDRAIVTNIDSDHLAHFGSMDNLEKAFSKFIEKASNVEHLFYCGDDLRLLQLCKKNISYGFSPKCAIRPFNIRSLPSGVLFDLYMHSSMIKDIFLPLYGHHNVLNGAAVYGLASSIGISHEAIVEGFKSFSGVKRRMEKKYDSPYGMIIDDYGHHPTEIAATLAAIRFSSESRPITAIYQPHRPSRLRYCMDELQKAFVDADSIVLTDLYLAGEPFDKDISTEVIFERIQKEYPQKQVRYIPRNDLVPLLFQNFKRGEIYIFFGAGDSNKASEDLAKQMSFS